MNASANVCQVNLLPEILPPTTLIAFFPLSTSKYPTCAKQSLSLSGIQVAQSWAFYPQVHQYLQNNLFICLYLGIKLDDSINSSWESSSFLPPHSRPTYKTIPLSVSFWESRSTEFKSWGQCCSNLCWVICIESSLFVCSFPKTDHLIWPFCISLSVCLFPTPTRWLYRSNMIAGAVNSCIPCWL